MLRTLSDALLTQNNALIILLASEYNNTATLLIKYGKQASMPAHTAHEIIKKTTATFGGGGGGRSDMAQAGGIPQASLEQALTFARSLL